MQTIKYILVTFLLLALMACSGKKDEIKPNELPKITSQGSINVLWKRKLSEAEDAFGYKLLPAFANGEIFAASQSGRVLSLNAESGAVNWEQDLEIELSAGPGVSDTVIAVGTPEGQVIAMDIDTGSQLWTSQVSSEILAPPVIDRNKVVVRSQDGRVYGFSISNGDRDWVFDTNIPSLTQRGNSTPVAKAGRLYVGFDSGKVAALNIDDGTVLWQQNVVNNQGKTEIDRIADIDGEIGVLATELFISSIADKTMAVAAESGRVLWVQDFGSSTGITVSRRSLFMTDESSVMYQINRSDGSLGWKQDAFLLRKLTRPAYYQGVLVSGDLDGYIHLIDSETGEILNRTKLGSAGFFDTPLVVIDTVYAYNQDGTLSAFQYEQP